MVHKHGGDVYTCNYRLDFSANINFLGMPETVRSAAIKGIERSLHYPDPKYRTLKEALAKRENCRAEQIICGNGAAELMFALVQAKKPARALLAAPSFYEYEQALLSAGCKIERVLLKKEEEFRLDQCFLDYITPSTEMIILGNPNNPTGRILDREFLDHLSEICLKQGIMLVLDESFFDFLPEERRMKTWSGVQRITDQNIFVIRSFTKLYAMPGLRFGYGICGDLLLLETMRGLLQPWNVSVPASEAACKAAEELKFAERTAVLTADNRRELKEALETLGYRVYPSDTNFLLFEGPADLGESCRQHGYLIRDCSNFPGLFPGEQNTDNSWFRICVRSREENRSLLEVLRRKN